MKLAEEKEPEEPEEPGEEITATAKVDTLMGASRVTITVTGAELKDVTKVLINGEEAGKWEIKGDTIQALTGDKVTSVKIAIGEKEYPVDIK